MTRTNLISILSHGWFDSSGEITDERSVSINGWGENDLASEEYTDYPINPFDWANKEGADYDPESELYDILVTEAFNLHGIPMVFYVTTYNLQYDKLLGEDPNRSVQRMFNIQTYYELPNEEEVWSRFGIEGMDNFHIYVTMRHFNYMSTFDQYGNPNILSAYIPQEGDLVKAKYNNYFYEVLTVKKQTNQIHRRVHIYDLIVKPLKDQNFSVSAAISFDGITDQQEIDDIFDNSDVVDNEKNVGGFIPPPSEPTTDPFLNW